MFKQSRIAIHQRRWVGLVLVGLALTGSVAGCSSVPGVYVFRSADATESPGGTATFDPETYAQTAWTDVVPGAVESRGVDVATLLPAIAADPDAAGAEYGVQAGTGSPFAFFVTGEGVVSAVDRTLPTGPVTVTVTTPDGDRDVTIVTGPVIAGTALRDAAGIAFSDFTNQLEYADVATQLNTLAKENVVAPLDLDALTGATIRFAGAFSLLDPDFISIVPTMLEVQP